MINYMYLQYWKDIKENIELLEKLLTENLYDYFTTREIKHLEYITENVKEIQRLEQLKEEYYKKIFS